MTSLNTKIDYKGEYESKTKCHQVLVCVELGLTVVFLAILHYALVSPLWDQFYLDQVTADWNKSPFVQVKEIGPDEECGYYSMYMNGDKEKYNDIGYYSYEVVGQGYWWGLKKGCVCNSGTWS